jgi:hypothetical protein
MRAVLLAVLAAALLVPGTVGTQSKRPLAPNLSGTTLDGKKLTLSQFRGRPVFINVWSSW